MTMEQRKNEEWYLTKEERKMISSVKVAGFILSEAEKRLSELNAVSNKITDRCYMLLSLISVIGPALIGVVLSTDSSQKEVMFILMALSMCIIVVKLLWLSKPYLYYPLGDSPANVVYKPDLESENPELSVMLSAIEVLQNKIYKTNISNEKRAGDYLFVVKSTFALNIIILLFFVIANLLRCVF